MKLFGREWGTRVAKAANPNFAELLRLPNGGKESATTASSAMRLYRNSSAASIPIGLIANEIKQFQPVFIQEDEISTEAPELLALLNQPAADWTRTLFMESLSTHVIASGAGFIWAGGNIDRPPIAIEPVSPEFVTLNITGEDLVQSYHVTTGPNTGVFNRVQRGRTVRYLANNFAELHPVRTVGTKTVSGLIPDSPLMSVADELNIANMSNDYNLALLENGGMLSLLFSLKSDLNDDDFQAAAKSLLSQYAGTNTAGSVAVVQANDIDVSEFGINPKDMGYKDLQRIARRAVALEYKIPPVLVVDENATFNNMDVAREMFMDSATLPWARVIFNGIEDFLFMRFGIDDPTANLWFDEFRVPSLRGRRIREAKELKEVGSLTDNEIRGLLAREPLSAGADAVYHNATQVAFAEDQDTEQPQVLIDDD